MNISIREFIVTYSSLVGVDETSKCAYDLINKARTIAYPLGDWVGTLDYLGFNADAGEMILPSEFDFIRGVRSCSGGIIDIENGHITKDIYCDCDPTPVVTKKVGKVFLPFQLTEDLPLFSYAVNKNDTGKKIRFQYEVGTGTRMDETIDLLHLSPTVLSRRPSRVLRISKSFTSGVVAVATGYDPKEPRQIAYISGNDINPTYSKYCFNCSGGVALEVKKRMMTYSTENIDDVLDINPEALSMFIAAVIAKDSRKDGWQKDYAESVRLAVQFLKQEQIDDAATNDGTFSVQVHDHQFDSLVASDIHTN